MFAILILLFTILPALELVVIIKVGSHLGALKTILILIGTGVLGAWLARLQGFLILNKIQDNLNRGVLPSEELLDGALILVAGVLLLTPGFITDVFGILLLVPGSRDLIKFLLRKKIQSMMNNGKIVSVTPWNRSDKRYNDIDIN